MSGSRLGRPVAAARLALFTLVAAAGGALAQAPAERAASPALPATVLAALREAGVGPASFAAVVSPLDGGSLRLAANETVPMNPASAMKLVTTYAALGLLGPAYRWRTQILASRAPAAGRLDGDLILRGGGDPSLVIERWWLLLHRLRAWGLRDIHGDLVLDKSVFDTPAVPDAVLDGNTTRPYNVAPDALLVNYKSLMLEFVPDPVAGVAHVIATPALAGARLPASVPLAAGPCGDWRGKLQAEFPSPGAAAAPVVLHGRYPRECGEQSWPMSVLDHNGFLEASFRALWRAEGGTLSGRVREAAAPPGAVALISQESPALAEVIRDINKYSNNVMARQLFLTLGVGPDSAPATAARAAAAVRAWFELQGLSMPELVLENGAGLSRDERISAASLARLLAHAWAGPRMPDFVASLPLAGVDGTMKNRHAAQGSAYVKTGYLAQARAIAGYVTAASGRRYAVVGLINDPNAPAAQAVLDGLLDWVWQEG